MEASLFSSEKRDRYREREKRVKETEREIWKILTLTQTLDFPGGSEVKLVV